MITVDQLNAIPNRPGFLGEWRSNEQKDGCRRLRCKRSFGGAMVEVWQDERGVLVSVEELDPQLTLELATYAQVIDQRVAIEKKLEPHGLAFGYIAVPLRELFNRLAAQGRLLVVPELFKNEAGEEAANWHSSAYPPDEWWISLHHGTDSVIRVFTQYADGVSRELVSLPIDRELIDLGMAPLLQGAYGDHS
jgi:hypothetical protein